MDQDRSLWDSTQIRSGLAALKRAHALSSDAGFYTLQAEIVACHASAPSPQETDWRRIAGLYSLLSSLTGSPVVELNRAVAVAMVEGPAAALGIVETLAGSPALQGYHLLFSVRGDLLQRLGRLSEAQEAFHAAASMTDNAREQALMKGRALACASTPLEAAQASK
jgi:predicted RNA polymerase sigma factor